MITHHPDEMTLLDFSAGNLNMALTLAISVHMHSCRDCQAQLQRLTALGGSLLETISPSSADEQDFAALMQQLNTEQPPANLQTAQPNNSVPATPNTQTNPLLRHLPCAPTDLPWQAQTRSISQYDLTSIIKVSGFKLALQKIAAGAQVPKHTHRGKEYTVILQGGFSDELGVYHKGDFIARDARHLHTPTALQNEDCICLTVLSAPLKFVGWQRVFNPFMHW
jgi:putative transcriptional regulator